MYRCDQLKRLQCVVGTWNKPTNKMYGPCPQGIYNMWRLKQMYENVGSAGKSSLWDKGLSRKKKWWWGVGGSSQQKPLGWQREEWQT